MNVSGIGNRIINLREKKNWSQKELARQIGISPSVMNRIELEDRPIKDYELKIIASVLDTTTDYLLGRILNEDQATYDAPDSIKKVINLLGIHELSADDVEELRKEDIDEIKKHIDYILFKAKTREE